ncbi:Chaperone protein DnaJ [Phytophthora cinnamomi]|uniref:Chaperone protein DnaJ n=1 Tax=Phytophthora cinnamomi TaxID=4785 RepID=UPI003559DA8D|nr:Chaperone protein DnaJ [Phytophthora cinnamomi]
MQRPGARGLSPAEQQKRRALLAKIAQFEARGAVLQADARTLRSQLHDSASGQWRAVEVRLQQLARSWNPYQDGGGAAKPRSSRKKLDLYALLGLENAPSVSADDVKRQFRKLALLLHPDKKRATRERGANAGDDGDDDLHEDKLREADSTQFARLRLAYETLSDPERRAAYDAKLLEASQPQQAQQIGEVVKDQIKLEASTDFASLEWMARVKHKMDVMARIAEWAKLLALNATELRFETGEPCTGRGCGKIVSMDRDLECSGSPRRRVYICLLHKYIHACDESCTSTFGDAELDRRVCPMRAYWLIQNWLFDQLQAAALQRQMQRPLIPTANSDQEEGEPALKRVKQEADCELPAASKEGERNAVTPATVCTFEANEIHLGDQYTRFQVQKVAECESARCRSNFQFLEDGIYACRRHGTPHICTFEQCDRQELHMGSYICWVSGKVYGREREEAGTDVRTRRVVYSDAQGDENSVEMEVPVMLPLGKTTEYLLEGDPSGQHSGDVSSLSPPPPDEKAWNKRHRVNSDGCDGNANDDRSPRRETRKKFKRDRGQERETSPVRKRLHQRLAAKIQRSETTSFHIFLKLPPAVAILPKVALELEEAADSSSDDEDAPSKAPADKSTKERLLQIFVNSHHTVNYIKYWMEELTEQQLSIWDQQIYWGDTLIGEETNVMVLEEHGISAGCVLELRLHDDCPLLVSTWNGKNAVAGGGGSAPMEYNTVQISKEAAEDLDDLQEEWENVVAAEEQAFELSRLKRKREKLELRGAIEHTEVLRYDNAKSEPRLLGVIQKRAIGDGDGGKQKRQLIPPSTARELDGKAAQQKALVSIKSEILIKEEQEQVPKGVQALRSLSNDAQPVKEAKKAQAKTKK